MKTRLLFTAVSVFLMMTTAQATEDVQSHNNEENFKGIMTGYRNAQPVLFQFNGVDYAVFPDGTLQYELPQRMITRQRGNRWNSRSFYNRRFNRNRGLIRHNRLGQVTRIGNTRISYFPNGQVARVGRLRMDYQGFNAVLRQVGGLEVRYNRRGQLIAARGCVNNREVDCRFQEFGTFQDADQDAWDDGIFFKRAPGQQ